MGEGTASGLAPRPLWLRGGSISGIRRRLTFTAAQALNLRPQLIDELLKLGNPCVPLSELLIQLCNLLMQIGSRHIPQRSCLQIEIEILATPTISFPDQPDQFC